MKLPNLWKWGWHGLHERRDVKRMAMTRRIVQIRSQRTAKRKPKILLMKILINALNFTQSWERHSLRVVLLYLKKKTSSTLKWMSFMSTQTNFKSQAWLPISFGAIEASSSLEKFQLKGVGSHLSPIGIAGVYIFKHGPNGPINLLDLRIKI